MPPRFRIGDLTLDTGRRLLLCDSKPIALGPLTYRLLLTLVEAAPNVVSHDELVRSIWGGRSVSPETISQRIKLLRDALSDNPASPRYVEGVRGQGYRLLPRVEVLPNESPPRDRARWVTRISIAISLVVAVGVVLWIVAAEPRSTRAMIDMPARTLAVLPFVNVSGDPGNEYFSDGLTDELLNRLASVPGLQVTGRTSSFSFKGRDITLQEVARQLNVAAVLEGSVRRADNRVRITMQLVDAQSGYQLWSENYDRQLEDVLVLQTEVAANVARALEVRLLGESVARLGLGGTRNPRALDAYLRARKLFDESSGEADERGALAALDEAVKLDPAYALAHATRARVLARIAAGWTFEPAAGRAYLTQAREAAELAVVLAPEVGDAHGALAYVLAYGFLDFTAGAAAYERALALSPGNAVVQREFALFAVCMNRGEAAILAARRAVTLDPLNPMAHRILGRVFYFMRRNEEALQAFQQALSLNDRKMEVRQNAGFAYIALGQVEAARTMCGREVSPVSRWWCLAVAYQALGMKQNAEAELANLMNTTGSTSAYYYAQIYAQWGRREQALQWLDTAFKQRSIGMAFVRVDPLLDPLRNEPRFRSIERELQFPD